MCRLTDCPYGKIDCEYCAEYIGPEPSDIPLDDRFAEQEKRTHYPTGLDRSDPKKYNRVYNREWMRQKRARELYAELERVGVA